jgi:hypothetical protein
MMRSINGKSFVIGGLLVLVAVCAMGQLPLMHGEYNGRFALVAHDKDNGSVYVVDTLSGQVWERGSKGFSGPKLKVHYSGEPVDPNAKQP